MTEINPFDASFQRSNEAAAAAAATTTASTTTLTLPAGATAGHAAAPPPIIQPTRQPPAPARAAAMPAAEVMANDDEDEDGEDAEKKRKRFLERNRVAAYKCRQKKKLWMQELEANSEEVVKRNKALHLLVNQLKEEAIQLKNQLLAHQNCDCNVIQQYVQTSGQFGLTAASRPPGGPGLPYVAHEHMPQH
ncbi:hypothetical protein THASP1DRAFT_21825 [Thamnocephalis sphaerospora]|uniref:BZIP domain-containing protein n=1 Tax=Thamnocephalis sphaerospora TaxID=78915 RepID=A0A4P9XVY6_9FUNG|nr:hypothetical protein THASP1DRAFT_21825 [Thamnocephalis sphaerospora]|eukprot:RKP10463.1 hypothetical protein THASP1DRAFT_21825 [Thamnocephalis sphaerospora]